MQNRWTLQVLTSLDAGEEKRFRQWWKKQLGGTTPLAWQLYEAIRVRKKGPFSEEDLWRAFKADDPFEERKLREYLSQLLKKLNEFLVSRELERDQGQRDLLLLNAYQRLGLKGLFDSLRKSVQKKLDKRKLSTEEDLALAHEMAILTYNYQLRQAKSRKVQGPPLTEINQTFVEWWQLKAIILGCHNRSHAQITGEIIEDPVLDQMLLWLEDTPKETSQAFEMYHALYKALDPASGELAADQLIQQMDNLGEQASSVEFRPIFGILVNTLVPQQNQDDEGQEITRALKRYYDWAIPHGLLFDRQGKQMIAEHFRNYIFTCLNLRALDEADSFFQAYRSLLHPKRKEDLVPYVEGAMLFAKGAFDPSRAVLARRKPTKPVWEIDARLLDLQIDYEQGYVRQNWLAEVGILLGQVDVLQRFVNNQELSDFHKTPFINRIKLFRQLLLSESKTQLETLWHEIHKTRPIDRTQWLKATVSRRLSLEYNASPPEGGEGAS